MLLSNFLTILAVLFLFDNTFAAITKSLFPKEYHISIEGSDEWDGTASENIPFTNTGPWLTIQNAITQLKNIRGYNPGPEDHVTVNIMRGTYYQDRSLKLAVHDSYIDFVSSNDAVISAGYSANFTWNKQGNVLSTRVSIVSTGCPNYSGRFLAFLKSFEMRDKILDFLRDLQDMQDSKNFQFFLLKFKFSGRKVS